MVFFNRFKRIEKSIQPKNPKYFKNNIRRLERAGISGLTFIKEGDVALGADLTASTRIGKYRENQEDAVALLKNDRLKMMIVSDGMGGCESGELASHIIIDRLGQWFSSLNTEFVNSCYENTIIIQQALDRIIKDISDEVTIETNKQGGATLVCAIIGKNNTLIANVGDSRACILKDGILEQITKDDALVQDLYDKGIIPSKDAMRFHKASNGIFASIGRIEGLEDEELVPHYIELKNVDYDMLLLFSDGVTDCLSEEEIAVICKTSDRKEIAQFITKVATRKNSRAPKEVNGDPNYKTIIKGGKDNATTAAYIPGDDEREGGL